MYIRCLVCYILITFIICISKYVCHLSNENGKNMNYNNMQSSQKLTQAQCCRRMCNVNEQGEKQNHSHGLTNSQEWAVSTKLIGKPRLV